MNKKYCLTFEGKQIMYLDGPELRPCLNPPAQFKPYIIWT